MSVRITANWTEVLRGPARAPVRVTADWIEVLRGPARSPVRTTAMWLEVLGNPALVTVFYASATDVTGLEIVNEPVFYETTVGVAPVGAGNFPILYESETSLSFFVSGDLTAGPSEPPPATYTNVTAVACAEIGSPPTLVVYQNVTQAYTAIVSPVIAQYRTVTAVAAREATLTDGRRDLLGGRLYKR